MRRRRRAKLISDINVVPYLDVMLVLLVIFMITAPLFNQGVVNLTPAGKTPFPELSSEGLLVNYSLNEGLFWEGDDGKEVSLSEEEIIDEIVSKLYLNPDKSVAIAVEGKIPHEDVMGFYGKLRDELESRGVPHKGRIGFAAKNE